MEIKDAPAIDLIKIVKPEYLDEPTREIYHGLKDLTNDFSTDFDITADEIEKLVSDIKKYFPHALMEHIDLGVIDLSEEAKHEINMIPKFTSPDSIIDSPVQEIVEQVPPQEESVLEPLTDNDLIGGKTQSEINTMIRDLLADKGTSRQKYSTQELEMLELYNPYEITKDSEIPDEVARKMWGLAYKYGFAFGRDKNVLDPFVRTGKFLKYIPVDNVGRTTFYEMEKNCWMISKILYPKFEIINRNFALLFYKDKKGGFEWMGLSAVKEKYDLVIGNPVHRPFKVEYGEEEQVETGAKTLDQYCLTRGIDLLKTGGLLVILMASDFIRGNSNDTNPFKDRIMDKADLLEAYRLPNSIFQGEAIGLDIVVMRKK